MPIFGDNVRELAQKGGNYPLGADDLSDDEKEDYYIKDTDALIVAGKIVFLLRFRNKTTPVLKFMSTNKIKTTFLCIMKSCCQLFLLTSNGSRSTLALSTATSPVKGTMLLLLASYLKYKYGILISQKQFSLMLC